MGLSKFGNRFRQVVRKETRGGEMTDSALLQDLLVSNYNELIKEY